MESFSFNPDHSLKVTPDMKQLFERDGYILIRSLLTSQELSHLNSDIQRGDGIIQHSFIVPDGQGRSSRLCLWNNPGDDITGMVGRCHKVAGTMGQLLGGEVYHYHTKLMMKEAHSGGSFVWHQDYGYWYNNGCLFPDMGTVFIAIDKCDRENGCLKARPVFKREHGIHPPYVHIQVLKGSHSLGRIEHKKVGGQMGADMDRVEHVMKVLPLVEVEMEPGDALFFHSNVLHRSDQNRSDRRRWAFLVAYNRASNNPVKEHHHPQYTKLALVPDSAIVDHVSTPDEFQGKDFMDPADDHTTSGGKR